MRTASSPKYQYQVGGSLGKQDPSYVMRQADEDLYAALKAGEFCYVLNSRQMGKSSLRVRVMQRLQADGIACGVLDISIGSHDVTPGEWYLGMIHRLARSFGLSVKAMGWWQERAGLLPVQRLSDFIEEVLLLEIPQQIVIFIDEIDSILQIPFKDDFFALIRACYNSRPDNPNYERLTFALLGVATPSQLIQDKKRTPFNIGKAIDLYGFQPHEVDPLAEGLREKVDDPQAVLREILFWSGGQPLLTQKLCQLIAKSPFFIAAGSETELVERLVRFRVIENWEAQDEPEHLRTIQDRILRQERRAARLLGMYQQILQQGSIAADGTPDQIELRLSGLVVERQSQLRVYNPIYAAVFDQTWVDKILANLRPYSEAITAWLASNGQDESRLLRGQALQDARVWASDKSLPPEDYRFLAASQDFDMQEAQRAMEAEQAQRKLETEREAKEILEAAYLEESEAKQVLEAAYQQAQRTLRRGSIGLAIVVVLGTGMVAWSTNSLKNAQSQSRAAIEEMQAAQHETLQAQEQAQNAKAAQQRAIAGQKEANQQAEKARAETAAAERKSQAAQQQLQLATQQVRSAEAQRQSAEAQAGKAIQQQQTALAREQTAQASIAQAQETLETARQEAERAQQVTELERDCMSVLRQLDSSPTQALLQAMQVAQELEGLVGQDNMPLVDYPAWSPILLLQKILSERTPNESYLSNEFRQEAGWWSMSIAFSPDGRYLATVSADGRAMIRDLASGEKVVEFNHRPTEPRGFNPGADQIVFSPDGTRLATVALDNVARLWDLRGNLLTEFRGHTDIVNSVSFSPNGQFVATASRDRTAKLWDLQGNLITTLNGHADLVSSVAFSPDGNFLVTGSYDNTAKIWDRQGHELHNLQGHEGPINTVAVSPDGQWIATASDDGTAKVWDWQGNLNRTIEVPLAVNHVSFSPDSQRLATASTDGSVRLWQLNGNGEPPTSFRAYEGWVFVVKFSPDGQYLATVGEGGSEGNFDRIWSLKDLPTGEAIPAGSQLVLRGHEAGVNDIQFSPDGQSLVTTSDDWTARLWDLEGRGLQVFRGHTGPLVGVSFSPNGQQIATASLDGTALLWDLSGREQTVLQGHEGPVRAVSFSPNGQQIATGSHDDTARLWDLQGRELAIFRGHEAPVVDVTFSPDGQRLATASADNTARLWDLDGNTLAIFLGHLRPLTGVRFSSDGQLLTASEDGTVRVWDLSGNLRDRLQSNEGAITALTFSRDGQYLATATVTRATSLWDREGHELSNYYGFQQPTTSVSFSPDGQLLATAYQDSTAILWRLSNPLEELLALGCQRLEGYLITHPDDLKGLTVCQNASIMAKAAPALVAAGDTLARTGSLEQAIAQYQQAQDWDPSLRLNPERRAQSQRWLAEGDILARSGDHEAALAKFRQALALDPTLEIRPEQRTAEGLVTAGDALAKAGDITGAINQFRQALALDSSWAFEPEQRARQLAAPSRVDHGLRLVVEGQVSEAIAAFDEAQTLDPTLQISGEQWNTLCWYGSLHGQAASVLAACEQAVALNSDNPGYRDSRGLARALTGDTEGAIEDFQFFIDAGGFLSEERQRWIEALQAGQNPFTPEQLQRLMNY